MTEPDVTEPTLPGAPDDSDVGWGESAPPEGDEALRRLLDERPPHHDR